MKKIVALLIGSVLTTSIFAQIDVTCFIQNASFDEDLTFQNDGSTKEIVSTTISLSDRSWAYIAVDSTLYARPKSTSSQNRPDGRKFEAVNGFIGRVNGWKLITNKIFPNCEWVYFGTLPYDLESQAIPIADDGYTYLEVPTKPNSNSSDDNIGALYLHSGWGGRAVYKQTVKLPNATYRLEYWAININPSGTNGRNLSKVVCDGVEYVDQKNFSAQSWTKHSIEFESTGDVDIEIGFESVGGAGSNPNVFIDGVKLFADNLKKCATPTISYNNGKLNFGCDTEGVEFVPSISLASSQHSNQIELFSVYRFSVYAKKEGYLDSDVASVNIDLNKLKGDMNNDGNISIADVAALVNVILGGSASTLYYSVGTDAVTANNYTTANNAQNVSSLSAIPSTLLTVTTPGVYYILLPDQFEPEVGGVVYYNVTKLNVNIPSYSVYRTASLSSGVQIKRVNVGTSGSQIDYE